MADQMRCVERYRAAVVVAKENDNTVDQDISQSERENAFDRRTNKNAMVYFYH